MSQRKELPRECELSGRVQRQTSAAGVVLSTSNHNTKRPIASSGRHVFPLVPNTKRPLVADWERLATDDAKQIRAWRNRYPFAGIGIACGPSDILVVDLDRKCGHDGVKTFAELCKGHAIDPTTRYAHTPNRGYHLYYRQPAGVKLRNTTGKLGPGIDTRGYGGYVACPPTTIDGRRYRWGTIRVIAPLPHVLRFLLEATPAPKPRQATEIGNLSRYVRQALDREIENVARAANGTRNDTLNRAAFAVGTLVGAPWAELARATAESALLQAAMTCGLPERESIRTIGSGLGAGIARPRRRK